MGKLRGLTPREIRSQLVLNGVKIVDIARKAGVTSAYIHHIINSTGRNRGYKIRPLIAEAIGKTENEIWPDDETKIQDVKAC